MLKPLGPVSTMAVVIANVADVITTVCNWNLTIVADVIATCNRLADVIANVVVVIATSVLAEDIAMVVDVKPHRVIGCLADVRPYVADVIATVSIYFNLSSEMLSRTSHFSLFMRKSLVLHEIKQNEKLNRLVFLLFQ